MSNPWGLEEGTKLMRYGITYRYEYDLCYKDWFLWDGMRLHRVSDLNRDQFDIVKEG